MERLPLTEKGIQIRLFRMLWQSSTILLNNHVPLKWWECDMFRLTKSGYFWEYEIKLSVVDFTADKHKTMRYHNGYFHDPEHTNLSKKHDLLAAGSKLGPSRFVYVVPETIIDSIQPKLPPFAGLLCATERCDWRCEPIISSPQLHRHKLEHSKMIHAGARASERYWRLAIDEQYRQLENERL